MIQFPDEIVKIIQTIEHAGFEAYAVGGCVRDSILGKQPEDWDLASNAPENVVKALFPDAVIVNKKLGVMRIRQGNITADVAAYRIDGEYKDFRRPETVTFTGNITEDLRRRDFTINAVAINPIRGKLDPHNGRLDIEKRLIRGIGDPGMRFEEDALRILRGIRFAAQLDFDIESETLKAMKAKMQLLTNISTDRIREEFFKTISTQNSGKGLALFVQIGVLSHILGEECIKNASDIEWEKFDILTKKIDKTLIIPETRAALVYSCFERERALKSIDVLRYSNKMREQLRLAVLMLDKFTDAQDKKSLKKLIKELGENKYQYLVDLKKQQCIAFELDDSALKNQIAMFECIRGKEAIFIKDLAVDGNDLKKVGIQENSQMSEILEILLEMVHEFPEYNKKTILLQKAEDLRIRGYEQRNVEK
ncbi:MAG: CCA tRNA nucleotidyltransferase [Anaerovoracaceae bacterium]|jgi:tRNA nucleotidyltransferase (CCA-adding enzyme)|nr:hypothetical protein [Clostridiales bacterium]